MSGQRPARVRASAASRISRSPDRKTRTSPGPSLRQFVDGVADRLVDVLGRPVAARRPRRRRARPSGR